MKLKKLALASFLAGALCTLGAPANATLILQLSDGANTVSIADGGAGDLNSAAGAITYVGPVGGTWSINVSTAIGTAAYPNVFGIDLASINLSNAAGTLRVAMSENGLSWGAPGLDLTNVVGAIGGTTSGSVSYGLYTDSTNALFGTGATVFTGTANGPAFAATGGASVNLADPFSMSLVVDITHPGPGTTSFDFEGKVPEPSSLALAGLGLLAFGLSRRRRNA